MKRLQLPLIAALALLTAVYWKSEIQPEPKSQILNNPYERLWKESKFDCKEFGVNSCFSMFIAMSACTFAQRINSGENVKESLDIADDLLYLLASDHKLAPNDIFDDKNLVKQDIRVETIARVNLCKKWAKEAIPNIVF